MAIAKHGTTRDRCACLRSGGSARHLPSRMPDYYLHTLSPFIVRLWGNTGLHWYGFAYVLAFVTGWWLYRRLAQRGYSQLAPDRVGDFITWTALCGVMLGGRLGYVVFYRPEMLREPLSILRVWDGGMSSHGGILGIIVFTYFYARKQGLSWTGLGDNLCVVAPVGIFFGRIANFINGELWGHPTTIAWAVQFPQELANPPSPEAIRADPALQDHLREILPPRHPSQLYEAALEGLVLFAILWLLRTRTRQPIGMLTGLFFILYAVLRIIGEIFRVPDATLVGPLTRGQFLSLFLILIGAAFVWYARKARHYTAADQKSV